MLTAETDVESYQDVVHQVQHYFEKYGTIFLIFMASVTKFNPKFYFVLLFEFATHKFQLWYFKNNYFGKYYSMKHWIKKVGLIPLYHLSLSPNSDLPGWMLTLLETIVLTNSPTSSIGKWREICFYVLLAESESVSKLINKLQEQSERYKNLVYFIQGVLITTNEKMNISFINKGVIDMTKEELIGRNIKDFPFYHQQIDLMLKTKKRQRYNWKFVNKDGDICWYLVDASIQHSTTNSLDEIVLLMHDISLEKKMEEKEKINIQNVVSLKSKNEFIASVSHEIRNPLQVISYNTENLLSKNLTQEVEDIVKDINSSTKFLTAIIGDILDHSKIEAGEMKIENQNFELSEKFITMNIKKCIEKSLKMDFDFDFLLPKFLNGDASRLLQIMNNLITNAIKNTKEGIIGVRIKLLIDEFGKSKVKFECNDTGVGISKENLKNLFDPFVQLNKNSCTPTEFRGW